MSGVLTDVAVYPLKGGRAIHIESWPVEDNGLYLDRRWMLVDGEGRGVTQRSNSRLALIEPLWESRGLRFAAPGMEPAPLLVPPDSQAGEHIRVHMDGGEGVWVCTLSAELNEWFSVALDMRCRLVHCWDECNRWVDGQRDGGQPINFHNAFPIHMVSQASLDDLNARLSAPVGVNRFRPNLVVSGTGPYEDDGWKQIAIGETILQIGRACDHRCGVPNVDQETGHRGVEPLKTLATYRRSDRGVYFGQNVTVERGGRVQVGDAVVVLSWGEGLTRRVGLPDAAS